MANIWPCCKREKRCSLPLSARDRGNCLHNGYMEEEEGAAANRKEGDEKQEITPKHRRYRAKFEFNTKLYTFVLVFLLLTFLNSSRKELQQSQKSTLHVPSFRSMIVSLLPYVSRSRVPLT